MGCSCSGPRAASRRAASASVSPGTGRGGVATVIEDQCLSDPHGPRSVPSAVVLSVLTVNAGSSSLKLRLLGGDDALARRARSSPPPRGRADAGELAAALDGLRRRRRGRRTAWSTAARGSPGRCALDAEVVEALRALTPLAPLHQPARSTRWRPSRRRCPDLPAVACLDTAFHATLPAAAATYALPREWRERHGAAALRLPRPLARLRLAPRGRAARAAAGAAAAGQLPPRRRRVAGGRRAAGARSTRRWASRRSRASSWRRARAASTRVCCCGSLQHGGHRRRRGVGRARAPFGAARPRRDRRHAGGARRARGGRRAAALARDVYVHRLRGADRRDGGGARTGSTRSSSRAGWASASSEIRDRGGATGSGSSASRSMPAAECRRRAPDADISADGAAVRTLVVRAREDLEMARQVRAVLAG